MDGQEIKMTPLSELSLLELQKLGFEHRDASGNSRPIFVFADVRGLSAAEVRKKLHAAGVHGRQGLTPAAALRKEKQIEAQKLEAETAAAAAAELERERQAAEKSRVLTIEQELQAARGKTRAGLKAKKTKRERMLERIAYKKGDDSLGRWYAGLGAAAEVEGPAVVRAELAGFSVTELYDRAMGIDRSTVARSRFSEDSYVEAVEDVLESADPKQNLVTLILEMECGLTGNRSSDLGTSASFVGDKSTAKMNRWLEPMTEQPAVEQDGRKPRLDSEIPRGMTPEEMATFAAAEESRRLLYESREQQQSEQESEAEPAAVNTPGALELQFESGEPDVERLDKLFDKALELGHPGLDARSVEKMKLKVERGMFTAGHYVDMWTRRLEADCNVVVTGKRRRIIGPVTKSAKAAAARQKLQLVFRHAEPPRSRMERVFQKALELGHPGIDEQSVLEMTEKVDAGEFAAAAYVRIWSKRLAKDLNVAISAAPPPSRSVKARPGGGLLIGSRGNALVSLGRTSAPHPSTIATAADSMAEKALRALTDTEERSTRLKTDLPTDDHRRALELLVRMDGVALAGNQKARGKLEELTKQPDPVVRRRALQALSHLDDEALGKSVAAVIGKLWDPDAGVRAMARRMLDRMDGRELAAYAPAFIRHAADPNPQARQNAHDAIEMVNGFVLAKHADRVVMLLNDPAWPVRRAAVLVLRKLRPVESALAAVMRSVEGRIADPYAAVRRAALDCLQELETPEALLPYLPAVLAVVKGDPDAGCRASGRFVLLRVGGAAIAKADARDWRMPLLAHVAEMLDDANDSANRRVALDLLATAGRENIEAYHPEMLRKLADTDWSVRTAARRALGADPRRADSELGRRQLSVTRAAAADVWSSRHDSLRKLGTMAGFEGADRARADRVFARREAIAWSADLGLAGASTGNRTDRDARSVAEVAFVMKGKGKLLKDASRWRAADITRRALLLAAD